MKSTEIERLIKSDILSIENRVRHTFNQGYDLGYKEGIEKKQPKTGHWITEDMFDGDVAYRCSECNELFWIESGTPKDNEYNFCPKCGTKMVEPQESEDKE